MDKYNIYSGDVIDVIDSMGYDAKSVLDSPNPVILALLDCISNQLFEYDEIQELSDGMREKFYSGVYDTYFINCLDSHMSPYDVMGNLKDEILEDLKDSFPELPDSEIQDKYKRLLEICQKYSF